VLYVLKEHLKELLDTILYYFPPSENGSEEAFHQYVLIFRSLDPSRRFPSPSFSRFFEKKAVLDECGLSSLLSIRDLKVEEALHQGIRLDRQHGLLQKIIHTTVHQTFVASISL